jgi:PAS domain S-box-containing protein
VIIATGDNIMIDRPEELVHLFIESIADYAIFIMDPQGRIAWWNTGAERLLGYQTQDILGHHFSKFFIPEEVEQGIPEKELEHAVREGRASDDRWAVRKDGSRLWVCGVTMALKDSALRGFGRIMRDHTSQMLAHEQIQRLNGELLQKVRDREQAMLELQRSQADLHETIHELERFEDVVIGRELKMVSLEKEVERLRKELAERS